MRLSFSDTQQPICFSCWGVFKHSFIRLLFLCAETIFNYITISYIYHFWTPNSRSVFRAGVSLNIHSFIRSFVCSFIHSFVVSFIRSFIHSFVVSLCSRTWKRSTGWRGPREGRTTGRGAPPTASRRSSSRRTSATRTRRTAAPSRRTPTARRPPTTPTSTAPPAARPSTSATTTPTRCSPGTRPGRWRRTPRWTSPNTRGHTAGDRFSVES